MREHYDFIAKLKYNTFDEGGRSSPAKSGYRPQVKFDFEINTTSGRQIFIGTDWVCPGETVEAEITILSPQIFENKLYESLEFKFMEGSHLIGTGKILSISNKFLLKK
jgi:translation elongation factor EF-Tu-like GTPase